MAKTISDEYKQTLLSIRQGTSRDWGTTGARNAGAPIAEVIHRLHKSQGKAPDVLDYGAGEGTLKEYLDENTCARVWEYDPGIPEKQDMPAGRFDLVVSTDVLEHIEPEHIGAVLDECFEKATYGVYHHIATCLTGHTLPDGRDYHILCESYEWWGFAMNEHAKKHGFTLMECSNHARRQRGEMKTSCRFYYERTS